MAMLKTISQGHRTADGALRQDVSGHTGSTKDLDDYLYLGPKSGRTAAIEGYLEHGHGMNHRPLAFGKTPELRHEGEHGWSREMDRTRKAWDKDFDRTYYHFTISADPEDHVGPEELRDVGLEWVRRALPGTQAVVSVHADNAGGIMHAHIVVNSVYPDTGRKIHRSNADVEREADICQDICREHGLGTLPYLRDLRRRAREAGRASISEQAQRTSVTEREMRARGARSWVGEIRDAVDACVATSRSWAEFEREMAARGLGIRRPRRGGVTYSHPDSTGHTYRIRSERLGLAYTEEGIRARIATSLDSAEGGAGAPARDGAMARKSIRSTRDAARYARRVGVVPKGAGRRRASYADGATVARSLRSVATAKRAAEAVGSRGGKIDPALVAVARDLAELEARTRAVEDGARAAEEALSLAGRLERVRAELRALPTSGWDPGTRARRADLVRESAKLEGEVEARLAGSQEHLAARGLLAASPSARARSVAERYRELAERLRIEVEDASGTLADVAATRAEMESRGLRVPSAFAPPASSTKEKIGRKHPPYVRTRDCYAPKKAGTRSEGKTQERRQETDHTQTQAKMTKRHPWPKP